MKLKSILAIALGAMVVFASCTKTDSDENTAKKSVNIEISGYTTETRAVNNPAPTNQTVKFTTGKLYFAKSTGAITQTFTIYTDGTATDVANFKLNLADLTAVGGKALTNISSDATEAVILANVATFPATTNINTVKKLAVTQAAQYDATNGTLDKATLYGQANLVPNGVDKFKATISVKPHVARIEIEGMDTKTATMKEYHVKGVFVSNYYSEINADNTFDPAKFVDNGAAGVAVYADGTAKYATANKGILHDWDATTFFGNALTTMLKTPNGGAVGTKVWGYNLLAPITTGVNVPKTPRIIVQISNVKSDDPNYTFNPATPYFVTIKGFTAVTSLEAGKVYTIRAADFKFDENNISITGNQSEVEVAVEVELIKWTAAVLTPELQ